MSAGQVRWSGVFRTLAWSELFFPAISRIFSDTQCYWCIFRYTHVRATESEEEPSSALFWKSKKVVWRKDSIHVHVCIKFSTQNVVLRVSRTKNSKMFHWNIFFLVFLMKCLSKCPGFANFICVPALRHSFCKILHLNCLTVSWIRLYLSNCLVICTVTLCYILHPTHSEFWPIQHH